MGDLSAILKMHGRREDFLLVKEAMPENRNINFILSHLLEKEEWHTIRESTRLNCAVTSYKMRKKKWMNALYSVSATTGDINAELEN